MNITFVLRTNFIVWNFNWIQIII